MENVGAAGELVGGDIVVAVRVRDERVGLAVVAGLVGGMFFGTAFDSGEAPSRFRVLDLGVDFEPSDDQNNGIQASPFLTQRLGPLGFVPDIRLFEFSLNLGQALRLALIVKDTSSTHQSVRRGRQWSV